MGATPADYRAIPLDGETLPGEVKVVGYNPDRRVALVLAVQGDRLQAVSLADRWVQRAGLVRPSMWRS